MATKKLAKGLTRGEDCTYFIVYLGEDDGSLRYITKNTARAAEEEIESLIDDSGIDGYNIYLFRCQGTIEKLDFSTKEITKVTIV